MNNELVTKLTSLGTTLIDLIQNGIDLASKEVPLIVNEAMAYWTTMSVVWTVVCLIAPIILAVVAKKAIARYTKINNYIWENDEEVRSRLERECRDDNEMKWLALAVSSIIVAIISSIAFFVFLQQTIMAFVAPRLFLLEHLKKLFE